MLTVDPAVGAFVAIYSHGTEIPYTFPQGWTPGNTTGEGPVLPKVRSGDGIDVYAGLVFSDHPVTSEEGGGASGDLQWSLFKPTALILPDGGGVGGDLAEVGSSEQFYIGMGAVPIGDPAPTTLPEGWTFRPYGIGQAALTDENAGCLIGNVAYVVSGYVLNKTAAFGKVFGNWRGAIPAGESLTVEIGDTFGIDTYANTAPWLVITAGTVTAEMSSDGYSSTDGAVAEQQTTDYAWPFLERYDLAAKTWLPRIPMPLVDETHPYASEGGIAGVIDGKLYFGGGDGEHITGQEFFVYDPADESFTRLDDFTDSYPDYDVYGTHDNKLYWFSRSDQSVWFYSIENEWASSVYTGVDLSHGDVIGDQVQGFEIDGKLWFVYDGAAFVFDPDALTVEAKAVSSSYTNGGVPFLIAGKIHEFAGGGGAFDHNQVYDPVADTWTDRTDVAVVVPTNYEAEFAGVTYNDTPYLLSAVTRVGDVGGSYAGVYSMPSVGLDLPRSARVQDDLDQAPDTDWVNLDMTLAAGGQLRYRRLRGVVYLEGTVVSPPTYPSYLTLPVGFRPDAITYFMYRANRPDNASTVEIVVVNTNGTLQFGSFTTTYTNYLAASFPVA